MDKYLTLVIPTYNRYERLLRLLEYYALHNLSAKIRVLDSSNRKDIPGRLHSLLESEDVDYLSFPDSISPIEKYSKGVAEITTPYTVCCADDDFITPSGIKACIDFLETHHDYSSAQGRYVVFGIKNGMLDLVIPCYFYGRNIDINGGNPKKRIVQQFEVYVPQYYAVHRTKVLQAFSEIVQTVRLPTYSLSLLGEILVSYVAAIYGKHKVLPTFYGARAPSSGTVDAVPLEIIFSDPKYASVCSQCIQTLTSLLSTVEGIEQREARSQILKGIHAYLNVFLPLCRKGTIRWAVPVEEVKSEDGYPFFDNTAAINEWQRIQTYIVKSLPENSASVTNKIGADLFNKGDKKGALAAFLRAVELDPRFALAHNNLGVLYWQSGEKHKALQHFVKAFEIDKNSVPRSNSQVLNQLGEALYNSGDKKGAVNSFSMAVEIDPSLAIAHNNLGVLYWQAGEHRKALEHFIKAFEIDGNSLPKNNSQVLNQLGEALYNSGDEKGAQNAFSMAVEIDPNLASAYNNLGVLYMLGDQINKALDYFLKAFVIDSGDRDIVFNLVEIFKHFENFDATKKTCVSYLRRNADDDKVSLFLKLMGKRSKPEQLFPVYDEKVGGVD